jgi:hypothetical protein
MTNYNGSKHNVWSRVGLVIITTFVWDSSIVVRYLDGVLYFPGSWGLPHLVVWLEIARLLCVGEITWLQGVLAKKSFWGNFIVIRVITFGQCLVGVRITLICMIDVGRFSFRTLFNFLLSLLWHKRMKKKKKIHIIKCLLFRVGFASQTHTHTHTHVYIYRCVMDK